MPPRALLLTSLAAAGVLGGSLLLPPPASGDPTHRELAYPDSRFVRLHGVEVHHLDAGREEQPALLLSHHFYGSAATWRALMAALEDRYRLVAFDRPGFGLTERLPRERWEGTNPYTRESAARLGWALLDHLGIDEAVLVGSSAGGTNVLEMARQQPDRVRAMVLLSPAITGDVGPPDQLRPILRSPQARAIAPHLIRRFAGEVDLARATSSWADPSRATPEIAEPYQRMLRVQGWERGFWEVMTAEGSPDLGRVVRSLPVPALVVSGGEDRVIHPRWNRRTADALPDGRYLELEGCGHTPQEECPEALAAAIDGFLAEVARGGPGTS
ncbi:MAG: alpha/beta fold hydrolase [Nitriliruptoraceae bacterium]